MAARRPASFAAVDQHAVHSPWKMGANTRFWLKVPIGSPESRHYNALSNDSSVPFIAGTLAGSKRRVTHPKSNR